MSSFRNIHPHLIRSVHISNRTVLLRGHSHSAQAFGTCPGAQTWVDINKDYWFNPSPTFQVHHPTLSSLKVAKRRVKKIVSPMIGDGAVRRPSNASRIPLNQPRRSPRQATQEDAEMRTL